MSLLKSKRASLIATQTVVVVALCVGLYFLLLKPDSKAPLAGAGVPGGPRAAAGHHGHVHSDRASRHRDGRHPTPRQHGMRLASVGAGAGGALPAAVPGTDGGAWPSDGGSGPPGADGGNQPQFGPGEAQYSSTVAAIEAKLAQSAKAP
jgi:hypothetical protein